MPGRPSTPGRLLRLEVDDFKSYRGRQEIGPFKQFTAVIGPNGAGKSNLMDAISFVLGVRTAHLRGNLKELLYCGGDPQAPDRPRRGFVKLVYQTEDGDDVVFQRSIVPNSAGEDATYQSQYRIDDRVVTWEAYKNKLGTFGILVKARNFLVFQGDIESVAAMQPRDVTTLFESISGSEALRKDYEAKQSEKTAAEERVSHITARKRQLGAEKRQVKEQKEEAEKHLKLLKQLEELRTEYKLWQVHNVVQDISKAEAEVAKDETELAGLEATRGKSEAEVKKRKAAQAGLQKERMVLEKKIKKKRTEADSADPDAVKTREEVARLMRKLRTAEAELETKQSQAARQTANAKKLEEQLAEITAAQEALEQELREEAAKGHLQLDDAAREEYNRIKQEAGAKTSKLAQDLASLQTTQKAEMEAMQAQADVCKGVTERITSLEETKAGLEEHKTKMVAAIEEGKASLAAMKKELDASIGNNRRAGAQRDFLAQKLDEVEGQLKEAKADRRESERERIMLKAVANMRQLFTGVYGRVTELCKVSQRKYNLAIAVLMGKNIDSIVVDSERTAKDCIQYLKDQGVPPMTFIPIQTVKAKPVNERLRELGGTAKLALDILEFDDKLERAFNFICGSALVCDGVSEAKRLAYMGPERHKVVAQDGTLIAKSGCITGGLTGNEAERAQRFDEQRANALKEKRAQYSKELADLPAERAAAQNKQRLSSQITGLAKQLEYKGVDLKATEEKLGKLATELQTLGQERRRQAPGLAKLEKAVRERDAQIVALEARITEVEDRMFGALSARLGVDNVREQMEAHSAQREAAMEQKMKLAKQAAKLTSSLDYYKRNDLQAASKKLEQQIKADKHRLADLQKAEAAAKKAAEATEAALAAEQETVEELRSRTASLEAEVADMRKVAAKHNEQVAKVRRELASRQALIQQLETKCSDILQAAAMDQVELPRADDHSAAPMETEEAAGEGGAGVAAVQASQLDFSRLKRQHVGAETAAERDKLAGQLESGIEDTKALLERVAPNLKAMEQYETVKAREREQQEELDEARATARSSTLAFEQLRQDRTELFMAAFQHVADTIDGVYTELTRSSVHTMGGKAELSLENAEEPFLGGIKFFAVPPTKRYRDMDMLSGGEKTVAALALLFAIHTYQPSPFFVLDEIDAALDATNVARVAAYIRDKTHAADDSFQSIVISLKDIFYEKADALIGVARDTERGCSKTLTFDLNAYG